MNTNSSGYYQAGYRAFIEGFPEECPINSTMAVDAEQWLEGYRHARETAEEHKEMEKRHKEKAKG